MGLGGEERVGTVPIKTQERIIALRQHRRALQVFKQGDRKNEHNGEPFHKYYGDISKQ